MAWTDKYITASAPGGGTGAIGSPWTLAEGITNQAAGMRLNIQAGTYASTTTTRSWIVNGTSSTQVWWRGYKTTPGDLDIDPTTPWVAGTDTPLLTFTTGYANVTAGGLIFSAMDFLNTGAANPCLFQGNNQGLQNKFIRCRFEHQLANSASSAWSDLNMTAGNILLYKCYMKATTTATAALELSGSNVIAGGVVVHGCAIVGGVNNIKTGNLGSMHLRACSMRDAATYGVLVSSGPDGVIDGCSIRNSGSDAIHLTAIGGNYLTISNNVLSTIGGYGINNATGTAYARIIRLNNLFYSCTSGNETGFGDDPSWVSITDPADPFTSSTNLTLKSTSGGVSQAIPPLFEGEGFVSSADRGAVGHTLAAAGGLLRLPGMSGGLSG